MVVSESSCSFWLLCSALRFLATIDVSMRWLAVETSNVPHVLKLASVDNSVCRWHRQLAWVETEQFTPLQLSLQPFCLVMNLWYKLDLKERASTSEIKHKLEQKQGGDGAGSCFTRSLTLQLAWFPNVAYPRRSKEDLEKGRGGKTLSMKEIIQSQSLQHFFPIPADIGWGWGTPWTSHQFVTGLTCRDKQPFSLIFTSLGNIESPINLPVYFI